MKKIKTHKKTASIVSIIILSVLLSVTYSFAGTYWVSNTGTALWSNCSGTTPLSGTAACALSTANQNAAAGDTVYLRGGTYNITGTGIVPANSGTSADNMITFSGYESEEVIIYGKNDVTGRASRGINLYGKSYVKVTKLIFTNLATYLYITNGSHHNEISYCTFKDMRDVWNVDIIKKGTHTGATGSSTMLEDANLGGGTNTYAYRRIFNVTDGSYAYVSNSSNATTVTHTSYPLTGGKNNYWTTGDQYKITYNISWAGSYIYEGNTPEAAVSHNWIHHNTFKKYGAYSETNDEGVVLELGVGSSSANLDNNYNTIENNHIYAGGHHVFGINASKYNVIRNNYFHNEGWYSGGKCSEMENGVCGYRIVSATVPSPTFGGHSLWENNRVGYGAAYGGPHLMTIGASGSGTTLATPANIYRYNDHFGNALYGLRLGASISTAGNDNRIYNNTFYHNGYGADDEDTANDALRMGISLYNSSCAAISGTVIKNNLLYDHWSEKNNKTTSTYYPAIWYVSKENLTCNTIENNYYDDTTPYTDGIDPLFTDPDITTPLNTTKPNLTLQSGTKAIDIGTYLTQANGAGSSSTTLVVYDASYFQDGTWGSDLARATLHADWIAIGTVDKVAQIKSINYDTNTITLVSPMSWNDRDPIWLYKKSDGTPVIYGEAPDMGAHEYGIEEGPFEGIPEKTLSTLVVISANGTVTSDPAGINCGTTCSADYNSETSVTLTAVANSGYTFTGWSGACSGTDTCTVTMTEAKSVTANYGMTQYNLTVAKNIAAAGTVTGSDSLINCGSTCSVNYESGKSVTLTAVANSGYRFWGWADAGCSGTGTCTLSMTESKSVRALFEAAYNLTVTKSITSAGTVTSSDGSINCGSTCSVYYKSATSVTLTASTNSGYVFTGWQGGGCSGTGGCTVSMTAATSVTATFATAVYNLTVTKPGTGTGTVTGSDGLINCGYTCSANYESGKSVTLTASAASGSTFTGWSGACSGTGSCILTMTSAQSVTANFAIPVLYVTYYLSVSKNILKAGTVMASDGTINCGSTCSAKHSSGKSVTLTASPSRGYKFSNWTGACTGTGTCTVLMNASKAVKAYFVRQ